MADDIVITGLGIVSPIGCSEQRFWESLCQGRSGASQVDCLDTTDLSRQIACQVREPVEAGPGLGRASQVAVAASRQAAVSAGLAAADVPDNRLAIIVGTTMGETDFIEERLDAPADQWLCPDHMRQICGGRPGCIARNVQTDLGAEGPAIDLYGACAAGNMAIAAARRQLLDGHCDIALAGGADGFSRLAFIGFMRLRVMAAGVCRPFDQKRDGLLVGEGAAIFVLERESTARVRGATVRARVAGCSMTCENYHPTRPEPDGDGLTRATLGALEQAGIEPAEIDYVCAHGTGTPQNDAIEVKVLERCFPQGVAFSSIKALTGHTMGAAAAMESVCCLLSLEQQTLIPTWHLRDVLEPCSLDALRGSARPGRVRHVLNNSAGFGGYNSSIILSAA
ncbi:MAG: beta-ketoacyl-[acyl-carrier-protein] synthase family protein [Planctomycetota bacterium]|jgi:3-oxoacyl-[acyl-carrier-protein] synthase II